MLVDPNASAKNGAKNGATDLDPILSWIPPKQKSNILKKGPRRGVQTRQSRRKTRRAPHQIALTDVKWRPDSPGPPPLLRGLQRRDIEADQLQNTASAAPRFFYNKREFEADQKRREVSISSKSIAGIASLYGRYLRRTPYFIFCCQGCTPWVSRHPPLPLTRGIKDQLFSLNQCDIPPCFGVREFKYAGIFQVLGENSTFFCLRVLRNKLGNRLEWWQNFWNNSHIFFGEMCPLCKKWRGTHIWRNFWFWQKNWQN